MEHLDIHRTQTSSQAAKTCEIRLQPNLHYTITFSQRPRFRKNPSTPEGRPKNLQSILVAQMQSHTMHRNFQAWPLHGCVSGSSKVPQILHSSINPTQILRAHIVYYSITHVARCLRWAMRCASLSPSISRSSCLEQNSTQTPGHNEPKKQLSCDIARIRQCSMRMTMKLLISVCSFASCMPIARSIAR